MDSGPSNTDPLIGTTFGGKYRIIERLGTGGMGGVYKAEHLLMSRSVAVKFLRSTLLHDDVLLKRFHHEAKAASQISHPNAVTLFDYGVEDGVPYLVMEYIEGKTLKALIAEEKPLDLERVTKILRQICSALNEAHRVGIVHRDIKPDNFMARVGPDGEDIVKVLDFGVSKSIGLADFNSDQNLTQAGMIIGTPQYISPEQCQGKELDVRCDIYSLGAVTYEMLTGDVPFRAPTVLELLVRVLHHEVESIRKFKPNLEIPPAVDAVVMKSLEKDRDKRFSSIMEFYRAFEHAAMGDQLRRRNIAYGVGAVIGAALLFTAMMFIRPAENVAVEKGNKQIQELSKAVEKAERDKKEALARAERLKNEAEELLKRNETEKAKAIQEQQLAAELMSTQTEEELKKMVAARAEAERSMAKLQQTAVEREEALRREREPSKRTEQEKQELMRQAEQARLESERKAAELKKIEAERAVALKQQQELAAQAEREKQEAIARAETMRREQEVMQREQEAAAKKAEQEKIEVQKQAEAAKAELARLTELAKKAEQEKQAALKQIDQAKKEAAQTPPLKGALPPPTKSNEEQDRLNEVVRKANKEQAEALRKVEEMKREAIKQAAAARQAEAEARKMKAEAERKMREAQQRPAPTPIQEVAPPPSDETEVPKKRRRCGPTWCL